jgi:hypothetical protein
VRLPPRRWVSTQRAASKWHERSRLTCTTRSQDASDDALDEFRALALIFSRGACQEYARARRAKRACPESDRSRIDVIDRQDIDDFQCAGKQRKGGVREIHGTTGQQDAA